MEEDISVCFFKLQKLQMYRNGTKDLDEGRLQYIRQKKRIFRNIVHLPQLEGFLRSLFLRGITHCAAHPQKQKHL